MVNLLPEIWVNLSYFILSHCNNSFIVIGYFNSVTSLYEREGGGPISCTSTANLNSSLNANNLIDVGYIGPAYMWCNNRCTGPPLTGNYTEESPTRVSIRIGRDASLIRM